jgi:hypothetical protein
VIRVGDADILYYHYRESTCPSVLCIIFRPSETKTSTNA